MRVNANFDEAVTVKFEDNAWVPSPMPGVERKMLDRIGEEVGRATTIVRFAPGSAFSPHTHDGGEEYLVLEGVFQDEDGDFPVGSYVRNPPTSSHTPAAMEGATILVKLHQFDPADRTQVQIDTGSAEWNNLGAGRQQLALHADPRETVVMERWAENTTQRVVADGGAELFVVEGSVTVDGASLERWDWARVPVGSAINAVSGAQGAQVWIKTGHLRELRSD